VLAAALILGASTAAVRAQVVDCMADAVVEFQSGFADPDDGFRYGELPGIALGPPGDSLPVQGSTSTVSLGYAGSITLAFLDNVIVDGPGDDFIVFENSFFKSTVPSSPGSPCVVFAEPVSVEVSTDGASWVPFPYDPSALALVEQDQTPCSAMPSLLGLAGITPTFTGNWTVSDDPNAWDPNGTGGVSGAGGDGFDLATVGLNWIRFVRLTDLDLGTGFAGNAEGADVDAVVALNAVPAPLSGADSDEDGLTDIHEVNIYATDPLDDDTDGDGVPDGQEVATCRSPHSSSRDPSWIYQADLHFPEESATSLRWNFLSAFMTFDLIRGDLGEVDAAAAPVDLGGVLCLDENSFNLTSADNEDFAIPAAGEAFFYLLRPTGGDYGPALDGRARVPASGDCLP
jgi:hypothetical protein